MTLAAAATLSLAGLTAAQASTDMKPVNEEVSFMKDIEMKDVQGAKRSEKKTRAGSRPNPKRFSIKGELNNANNGAWLSHFTRK